MTPEQALELLFDRTTEACLNKKGHLLCEQALVVLSKALQAEPVKPEDSDAEDKA